METIHHRHFTHFLLEGLMIMVFTLMVYLIFIRLLDYVFPQGTTFGQIMSEAGVFQNRFLSTAPANNQEKKDSKSFAQSSNGIVAKLASITKDVKHKLAGELTWNGASAGHRLYNQDSVQTFQNSSAKIMFDKDSFLELGENSLIIIKKLDFNLYNQSRRARLILSSGGFFTNLAGNTNSPIAMEITTGNTVTKIQSISLKPAGFKVKINPDKSSTISVADGIALISTNNESIEIKKDQAITIRKNTPLSRSKPITRPKPVEIIQPEPGSVVSYHEAPEPVKFSWKKQLLVNKFHLVVAKDKDFNDVILDKVTKNNFYTHHNLIHGEYYWKVRGNVDWIEGRFSKTHHLKVKIDIVPPKLQVNLPPDIIKSTTYNITGTTAPGMKLFINDRQVKVSKNGKFNHTIKLNHGANLINVESLDSAGNVSYKSKIVNVIEADVHAE